MIIKLIVKRPLNPSIKLAPLIMNKKQSNIKIDENKWLFIKLDKTGISMLEILIGKKYIKLKRSIIIIRSLFEGLMLILRSSKKPTENIERLTNIYSYKIFE